jgi:hypothetical protein
VAGSLDLERDTELSRLLSFVVFVAGVFVPSLVAAARLFIIGVQNARLFGTSPTDPIDPGTDPMLWTTAVLITVAIGLLAVLIAVEARHRKVLVSGIVLAVLAAIPLALNWYVILD